MFKPQASVPGPNGLQQRVAARRQGRAARLRNCWLSLAVAGVFAACGGGVGEGGTGGLTTDYTAGPITGFGSVIVNDVVFEDNAASVEDGSGGSRNRTELRLGMTVEVSSDAPQTSGSASASITTAKANVVRFDSALLGPVENTTLGANSITVLGQEVLIGPTTVFDDALEAGLSALRPGAVLEVYAVLDSSFSPARFRATRIEPKTAAAAYRLRGLVSQVSAGAQTFKVGTATFSYAGASNIPADLANGQMQRLNLSQATDASGRRLVLSFGSPVRALEESLGADLKGYVNAYSSNNNFQVDGRPVNAATASVQPAGASISLGSRLRVKGSMRAGVLVASAVQVLSDASEDAREFELKGSIESTSPATGRFVLRGTTVLTSRPGLRYSNGTAASLTVGRSVEVKGTASGNAILATEIKFPSGN